MEYVNVYRYTPYRHTYEVSLNYTPLLDLQSLMTPTRSDPLYFKLSVSVTGHAYLLEIEGLFTPGARPGRSFGESVGGILVMVIYDWSK